MERVRAYSRNEFLQGVAPSAREAGHGSVTAADGDRTSSVIDGGSDNASSCSGMLQKPVAGVDAIDVYQGADDLLESLEDFCRWLMSTNMSPSSKRVHLSRARQLLPVVCACNAEAGRTLTIGDFAQVAADFLEQRRNEHAIADRTVNNFVDTFRLYARFVKRRFNGIEYISRPIVQHRVLTVEEVNALLNAARGSRFTRDRLMILLFLDAGFTPAEFRHLKLSDIEREEGCAILHVSNGRVTRQVVLQGESEQSLSAWLSVRWKHPGAHSQYVFFGPSGSKLSESAVDAAIRKVGWNARLNICARVLRNTFRAGLTSSTISSR